MRAQPVAIVDAFASKPYTGNPAAVCVLEAPRSESWMQSVAAEMNLAETAFLIPGENGFDLRWFSPVREVELCGHATLASAHHLWESGYLSPQKIVRFYTLSGLLTAKRVDAENAPSADAWIELDFPAEMVNPVEAPASLKKALNGRPVFAGKSRFDYLAELASEKEVREFRPDFTLLAAIEARGLIITARGSGEADIVSRCFYPRYGIDEDPVTGSAHCSLAPYWASRLGKQEMLAYQASQRGGWLRIRDDGDRVKLRGQAVTTLRGELLQTEG